MKCELKQQIGHSNISIAQQTIHEAAKVKNDSKIIKSCETLDLIASEVQLPSFMLSQLYSFCCYLDRYGKRSKKFN